jgi:glyoxylase-like metal-dependent hydrolase (beta-lactamase superfamily II)
MNYAPPPSASRRAFLGSAATIAAGVGAALALPTPASAALPAATTPDGPKILTYTAGEPGMHVNSHLLVGERETLLVDAQMLRVDAEAVADLVAASGRPLKRILITHAHPDHFLGTSWLLARFPDAKVFAPASVADGVRRIGTMARGFVAGEFGEAAAGSVVVPEALPAGPVMLDDLRLEPILFEGGECEHTLALVAADRGEILSSDPLYGGTHLYLGDRDFSGWRAHLDRLASLGITWARPGHGRPGLLTDLVAQNRRYLADFEQTTAAHKTRADAEAALKALYPTHAGARLLRFSLDAAYPAKAS